MVITRYDKTRRAIVLDVCNQAANEAFSWGGLDCCLLASRVVHEITGVDYGARFNYQTKTGALRIIAQCKNLSGLFTGLLGKPVEGGFDYGDPVLCEIDGQQFIAIWFGNSVLTKFETGLLTGVDIKTIIQGWRI